MQVINLNVPTNTGNSLPAPTNTSSAPPTESMSVNLSNVDICEKGGACNDLVYSMGSVLSIGQVPSCTSPSQSFQRSVSQPVEKRIAGGKSNTINFDLAPGEVKTITPSSVGLNGISLVQVKATCGDVLVSFDCENWFRVKQFLLDSSSISDCSGSPAGLSNIYVKNYYPPEGITTCDGQNIKRSRVETILVGS